MTTPKGSAAPAPSGAPAAPDRQLDPYAETLAELFVLQHSARLRTAAGMAQLTARFCKLSKRLNRMTKLSELFSVCEGLRKKALSAKTPAERMRIALLKHACESDILDMMDNSDNLSYGMDFGPGSETVEEAVEISPNGSLEILCSLRHPVLPCTLPIEMKGIAVQSTTQP